MNQDQLDLQALIEEDNLPDHEGFTLIGKIISFKPLHAQHVRTTMAFA